jgi:alkylation response protein AidB-like acyl-CoA dehydrogenase
MDFSFTDEQQMLLDTTARFIAERYDFEFRQRLRNSPERWSRDTWKQLADLGLLALIIPEQDGGIGAGPVGAMLVNKAIGEGMLLEPFLSSAIVATQAIVALGSPHQRQQWLPWMSTGELLAVLAHDETSTRFDPLNLQTTVTNHANGWRISGRKSAVYHATAADLFLVSARTEAGDIGLFAVSANEQGLRLEPCLTVDDQSAAAVVLDNVRVAMDTRLGERADEALMAVLDVGLAALCADALGAMEKILGATIEYSRARFQFGAAIGSFQALQHRMAEMYMHLEQARSMTYLATSHCTNSDAVERRAAMSAAKALMGQAARFIGQQAVQLHGGMGMTDELNVSHYFKRLLAFELRCGTTDEHLEKLAIQLQVS